MVNFGFDQIPDFEEEKVNALLESKLKIINKQGKSEGKVKPISITGTETSFVVI